ncbi:hypothetical protein SAMN05421747_102343 [Parapedobacter composti]|uniref:DUF5689 domain-containing protein n=1 Tax=Parapedobacter composti TaxID=623281 RepID=A0A1I1FBT0_9SPHI|nr:DUF5689 domain-containing protein [Parapedobacter composti]SFB96386.1 hypothetical protein SAMN05421747_102343 [Parapedobacter composti]
MKKTVKFCLVALSLSFLATSCNKDSPSPQEQEIPERISIEKLKTDFSGKGIISSDSRFFVTGVVITDAQEKNIENNRFIVQDGNTGQGIVVETRSAHGFSFGDSVKISIAGGVIEAASEEIFKLASDQRAEKVGTGTITARSVTVEQLLSGTQPWQSILVKLGPGSFSGGEGYYSGKLTYDDGTGSVQSNIMDEAAFRGRVYPLSVVQFTGVVRKIADEWRVDIVRQSLVEQPNDLPGITYIYTENFQELEAGTSIAGNRFFEGLSFISGNSNSWLMNYGNMVFRVTGGNSEPSDQAFLENNRAYLYGGVVGGRGYTTESGGPLFVNIEKLKGAKMIAINLANSFKDTFDDFPETLDLFDPEKHALRVVTIGLPGNWGKIVSLGDTVRINDQGKFHRIMTTIPDKEGLIECGFTESEADAFLSNPWVGFRLITSLRSTFTTGGSRQMTTPVVVKSIEIGYEQRPDWAN